jgi:integrase
MLYKRGHTYWYKFKWKGQEIYRSTKTRNKEAARQIESAHRVALAKGEAGLSGVTTTSLTLAQFNARFFAHIGMHVTPRTLGFYRDAWARLMAYKPLANAQLSNINRALIDEFALFDRKQVSVTTVNHALRTLRRALKLADEWELIIKCPKIQLLPGERQREYILSDTDTENIKQISASPLTVMLPFLKDTGLRITEACQLKWERVNFEPTEHSSFGSVFINRGKSRNAKRHMPLTQECRTILEFQKGVSRSEYVFVREDGVQPVSRHTVSHQFTSAKKKLGLPWDAVLHSTRHTYLTNLGASGADAFTIKKLAGHGSVTTSERYVHPVSETVSNAMKKFDTMKKPVAKAQAG